MDNSNSETQNTSETIAEKKAALELEKLEVEVDNLKRSRNNFGAKLVQYNIFFTVAIAVMGAVISIYQLSVQQANSIKQLNEQAERDNKSRDNETRKEYWKEQNETYKAAIEAASAIGDAESLNDVKEEQKTFRQLYWGKMNLIESTAVAVAMKNFNEKLERWQGNKVKPEGIENDALKIAHCARKSLQNTWSQVEIGDLKDNQCGY